MGLRRHNIYLLLAMILSSFKYSKGSCEFTELAKIDNVCAASLKCDQTITASLNSWGCIKNVKTVYKDNYDYGYWRQVTENKVTYATNYELDVTIQNADDKYGIFDNVNDKMGNIQKLQIINGNIYTLPYKMFLLTQVTEIEISNNQLSTVDLNSFIALTKLTVITLRNNSIYTLEMETQAEAMSSRSIKSIDLSQNRLELVPNACFFRFTDLQHLNLSYNRVRSFDILTFEGIMELKTLDVSHNMLFEIGNSLTRFINLQILYLQNNIITNITDYNLNTLLNLEKLNLSSNAIDLVENNTFKNLIKLAYLDLSNNSIEMIPKNLFEHNSNLHSVFISKNRINYIENNAFDDKNITEFDIKDNNITGNIEQNTLKGVHVSELDFSNGKITSIGNDTFKYMCNDLSSLNMSFNTIHSIAYSAFSCLDLLTTLDLSHNYLDELNFETSSLTNLSMFNATNNNIKKITKSMFRNLISLKNINLSHNKISEVESQTFLELQNVDTLTVTHNPFVNILVNNTFSGLIALKSIDLSFTRTTSYQNGSFSGLNALEHVNSTFGQLSNIAYNTFMNTGQILKLDLSHNLLDNFCINTSHIPYVSEIYLNDNKIRHISNNTFSGLRYLTTLNLVNNNVQKMEAFALENVEQLRHLYLSFNKDMEIIGNPFDNMLNLYQVNMDGVKTRFSFQNATRVSILGLNLHSCGIQDLNKLFIFNIDVSELDLSANEIMTIDKFSFQSMFDLVILDLSSNVINFVQPGSFLHVNKLHILNLSGNNIQTLQFGVFDGIKEFKSINLSNNALQSFDPKLLPVALDIALDNNDISNLNFEEFLEKEINKLSLGGNIISCKVLAELKTSNYSEIFQRVVTTAILDFHSENVNGISCQSSPKANGIYLPVINNTNNDISPIFIKFTDAVNNLRSSIEIMGNKTSPDTTYQMKSDVIKIVNSIQTLVNISNQTHIKTEDYFKMIENLTDTNQMLKDIEENIFNLTNKAKDLSLNYDVNDEKTGENIDDIRSVVKIMLKEEIDVVRKEFEKTLQDIKSQDPLKLSQVSEKDSRDDKVLYFIAASLGFIIVLYSANLVYAYFKKYRRLNTFHDSRRPITNSEIEME